MYGGDVICQENATDTYEKYSAPDSQTFSAPISISDSKPDVYEMYLAKVDYIIGLINGLCGNAGSLAYNRSFLEDHYQEISEIDGVNIDLVDWYIDEAKYALISQSFPASSVKLAALANNYSRTDAVDYANTYWSTYNTAYPDWTSYGGIALIAMRQGGRQNI
ncbi:MAG: amidase domain-containing protein [Clostridiales bacterium]|jgi:hypothetical protein|nr:amidase domain-containing protein [Clostridiales bacterium]